MPAGLRRSPYCGAGPRRSSRSCWPPQALASGRTGFSGDLLEGEMRAFWGDLAVGLKETTRNTLLAPFFYTHTPKCWFPFFAGTPGKPANSRYSNPRGLASLLIESGAPVPPVEHKVGSIAEWLEIPARGHLHDLLGLQLGDKICSVPSSFVGARAFGDWKRHA